MRTDDVAPGSRAPPAADNPPHTGGSGSFSAGSKGAEDLQVNRPPSSQQCPSQSRLSRRDERGSLTEGELDSIQCGGPPGSDDIQAGQASR